MMSWINVSALWKIVVYGLLLGAGLPTLFAVGLRALALAGGARLQTAGAGAGTDSDSDQLVGGNVLGMIIAGIIFLIILAALAWASTRSTKSVTPRPPHPPRRADHRGPVCGYPLRGLEKMALPPRAEQDHRLAARRLPEGVSDVDYIPLFALLGSQLTNDQVAAISDELANQSKPESAEAIRKAIVEVTDHKATDADVNRSRPGWRLAESNA
jgi:hypothetical protein